MIYLKKCSEKEREVAKAKTQLEVTNTKGKS